MSYNSVIKWLLEGDVSIQYQVHRDLLNQEKPDLQQRIRLEGWGARYLKEQNKDGHWGKSYYNPKWISTHYTLLTLKHLCIGRGVESINKILDKILYQEQSYTPQAKAISTTVLYDDVCVNGMFLNFTSYFLGDENKLTDVIDFILSQQMDDGGFNCMKNRSGARHSSLHSTISVLEGLSEYLKEGDVYREDDIQKVMHDATEFILMHKLYMSDRNGRIIHPSFLKFPFPTRWKYDIMRAMDYFQHSDTPYDERMMPAIDYILSKRLPSGKWKINAKYPGQIFFNMEKAGTESRWNTLRALRIMKKYLEFTALDLVYTDLLAESTLI